MCASSELRNHLFPVDANEFSISSHLKAKNMIWFERQMHEILIENRDYRIKYAFREIS